MSSLWLVHGRRAGHRDPFNHGLRSRSVALITSHWGKCRQEFFAAMLADPAGRRTLVPPSPARAAAGATRVSASPSMGDMVHEDISFKKVTEQTD